jgi:UDP-2,3-diacylglucosamine pyrophosphatase LpxH
MPDIRYVCISDLHLGADNSLLTRLGAKTGEVKPDQPSEVLTSLANCLRELVRHNEGPVKPTLILNGDALELALAEDNVALMAFERFIELMFPVKGEQLIASNIIFNPGNHDHHLWETARETQYVEFLKGKRSRKPGTVLPPPWHTTRMFNPVLVDSCLLNAVIGRHPHISACGARVGTVYPNLCLLNTDESRCVIFSHGHFIEPIYMLMTTIGDFVFPNRKVPEQTWEIEVENFAWIDFFWSTMGRSGEVGKAIEQMYDMLLVPEARKRIVRQLARAAGRDWLRWMPKAGEWLCLILATALSKRLFQVDGLEKTRAGEVLSPAATQGLKSYIEGPLARQVRTEHQKALKVQTTFVFGHTHKPFSAKMNFSSFDLPVDVYNNGGWVVDTKHTETAHGGAILLIDEQMNVVSLRMYNEAGKQKSCPVRVEALDSSDNPLYTRISRLVEDDRGPWLSFSSAVARSVGEYHERFRERLNMARPPGRHRKSEAGAIQ